MTVEITESLFRRRLELLLNKRRSGFSVPVGADPWGMTIKRPNMQGVLLWYSAESGLLTLGLTTAKTRSLVPVGACPPGATFEESPKEWKMYRCPVPVLDLRQLPEAQEGTMDLVEAIIELIAWFNSVRLDNNPAS